MEQKQKLESENLDAYENYIHLFAKNKNHPIKIIMNFYKGNVLNMLKSCVCLICQRSPAWVIPIVTANIINIATNKEKNGIFLILIQFSIAAFFLLQNIGSTYLATRYFAKVNRKIEGTLRNALIQKLQYLSVMFHKESQSGKLQSKVIRDVENIYELLNQIFKTLFFFALDFLIILGVCAKKSPMVLLFFTIAVPLAVAVLFVFKKPVKNNNRIFRTEMEETQGAVAQMLEMIPVTRAHGLQETEIQKMNGFLIGIFKHGYQLDLVNSLFGACNWVTFQMVQLICLSFTAFMACENKISVGEVVLYQTYFVQLIGQITTLINIYPSLCKGMESLHSIGDVLISDQVERNNAIVPLENLKGDVHFCKVSFQYPDGKEKILDELELHVKAGESIGLVGPSGGGKSTILNLLIGFMLPSQGKILIDGVHMANLNMEEYRKQIAVVPQNSILFSGTIRENITYGMEGIEETKVWKVLRDVGLEEYVRGLQKGLDTPLGEHGDKLSGGQKQRLSIARALIRNPKIIILDEATSALDTISERQVQEAAEQMMKQCTTFIVAHRLSTIRNVDRILVLEKGKITEEGNYEKLIQKKGAFYKMEKGYE